MSRKKKWLYEKWLEDHRQDEEKEKLSTKIGFEKEQIVVKKVSFAGKALEIVSSTFFRLLYAAGILVIIALLSLAVTVLVNSQIREYVFNNLGLFKGVRF